MKPVGPLVRPCSAGAEGAASTVGALLTFPTGIRPLATISVPSTDWPWCHPLGARRDKGRLTTKKRRLREGSPGEPVPERGLQLGPTAPEPCHLHEAHSRW